MLARRSVVEAHRMQQRVHRVQQKLLPHAVAEVAAAARGLVGADGRVDLENAAVGARPRAAAIAAGAVAAHRLAAHEGQHISRARDARVPLVQPAHLRIADDAH